MAKFADKDITWISTDNGRGQQESVMFNWGIAGFGFGTTTFYYKDDVLYCDNETLSKESIKMLLCHFVDIAKFDS